MKFLLVLVVSVTVLFAKEGISLDEIFKSTFSSNVTVGQKTITLSKAQMKALQKKAKAKVDSNIIRYYVVKNEKKVVGYGVLVVQRIRTKKAAILYLIDKDEKIKNIEIIAFHEPSEYKPYSTWKNSFKDKALKDDLRAGYGIPTISGATLSARAISDASRIALTIVAQEKRK